MWCPPSSWKCGQISSWSQLRLYGGGMERVQLPGFPSQKLPIIANISSQNRFELQSSTKHPSHIPESVLSRKTWLS